MKRSKKIEIVRIEFRQALWKRFKQMCIEDHKDIHKEVNRLIKDKLTFSGIIIPKM